MTLIAAGVVAVAVIAVVLAGGGDERFRVAATFDTAKGMVAGQQVKIAGAVVGKVERVELAPGPKARVVMAIDRRFEPFHADARCQILPEGIISENYIACTAGSRSHPALAQQRGVPTVPLRQTSVPASLQDVLNVFAAPTSERIRILINELGIATAGRGEDLNALLRRTNPALERSRQLLAVINAQRVRLADSVRQTDRVVASLADDDQAVHAFVGRAADVATTTAARHDQLVASVRRLPPLLDETRPALRSLNHAMAAASPVLPALRRAAPGLTTAVRRLPAFTAASGRTLRALTPVADSGRRTIPKALPVVTRLRAAGDALVPTARSANDLLIDTRDRGGLEGILRWAYSMAAASSAYDTTSHLAGFIITMLPQCVKDASAPGCDTRFGAPGRGMIPANDPSCGPQGGAPWQPPTTCSAESRRRSRTRARPRTHGAASHARRPDARSSVPAQAAPPAAAPKQASLPQAPAGARPPEEVGQLLDYLLGS